MKPTELIWRIREQVYKKWLWTQWWRGKGWDIWESPDWNDVDFFVGDRSKLPELCWQFNPTETEITELLGGKFAALGYDWKWKKDEGAWRIAPDTGRSWPAKVFYGAISYRQDNPVGDVRVVWEPSRLQQLVSLALLAQKSSEDVRDRAIVLLEEQLLSWVDENPPLEGIHYISSMECALRILAVCYAYDLARPHLHRRDEVAVSVIRMVHMHADMIASRLSLYSSAGNHTIAECAGLIYAGLLFPELDHANQWRHTGLTLLAIEADRQILCDGGGLEQALWYHVFVLDLIGLVIKLCEHYQQNIIGEVKKLYSKGCNFLHTFASCIEELPNIGDGDNGYALSKHLNILWDNDSQKERLTIFKESGYTVYNDYKHKLQLIIDHGSLGMMPSYGHGHADALSIVLKIDGVNKLIDPGTFTYTGNSRYREYFKSTKAHNTVTVDNLDQAKYEAPFLWSQAYHAKLIYHKVSENGDVCLLSMHDGYLKLGVIHWRGVIILGSGNLVIVDILTGEGEHETMLNWHVGTDVSLLSAGRISIEPEVMHVTGGRVNIYSGEDMPPFGWRSSCYGVKRPSSVINIMHKGKVPHEFVTRIGVVDEEIDEELLIKKVKEIRLLIDESRKVRNI